VLKFLLFPKIFSLYFLLGIDTI